MKDVHNEVQVEVELELFRDEVTSEHFLRDKHLPCLKELVLLSAIEARWQRAQQLFWVVVKSKNNWNTWLSGYSKENNCLSWWRKAPLFKHRSKLTFNSFALVALHAWRPPWSWTPSWRDGQQLVDSDHQAAAPAQLLEIEVVLAEWAAAMAHFAQPSLLIIASS